MAGPENGQSSTVEVGHQQLVKQAEQILKFLREVEPQISFGACILAAILIYRGPTNLQKDLDLVAEATFWIDSSNASEVKH